MKKKKPVVKIVLGVIVAVIILAGFIKHYQTNDIDFMDTIYSEDTGSENTIKKVIDYDLSNPVWTQKNGIVSCTGEYNKKVTEISFDLSGNAKQDPRNLLSKGMTVYVGSKKIDTDYASSILYYYYFNKHNMKLPSSYDKLDYTLKQIGTQYPAFNPYDLDQDYTNTFTLQ